MRRIAHIVNIANFPESPNLRAAQRVTLETMRLAGEFAKPWVDVRLISAQFPEDRAGVPEHFVITPDLERSVLDIGQFRVKRRLPLMRDILERVRTAVDADYVIYTNIDIGLLPEFYVVVDRMLGSGLDAFTINRRTITPAATEMADIPSMWAEVGKAHMGHDCFIFAREACAHFDVGNSCVGAPHIGKIMLINQVLTSRAFRVFHDWHVTFHIGNDKRWTSAALRDYEAHNQAEVRRLLSGLSPEQRERVRRTLAEARSQGLRRKLPALLGLRT